MTDYSWKHPGIHYIPHEGKLIRIPVELPKSAYIRDLKRIIGERMNVDPATVPPPTRIITDHSFFPQRFFHESFINITLIQCF